jgi:ribosomal protein L18
MKMNKLPPLPVTKRYVLRLFISLKYITANVTDRKTGCIAASASSIEKALKDGIDFGRTCNTKAAAGVGEVLAMRLKVSGLHREPIYANPAKEVEKKGFKIHSKVWAIFDALRSHGVNLQLDSDEQGSQR